MFAFICVFLLVCFVLGVIEECISSSNSSVSSSSSELTTVEETEEEGPIEEEDEDDDTLLALLLARDVYELEKRRSHAVCSQCVNARWSSDDEGNEYCECPHIGRIYSWEADQERYCEHYET